MRYFFQNVPAQSGIAYVVILHLSPDHDSRLAEVLQSASSIPVTQVTENTRIQPDHVYVVPPNQHLILSDGYIAPSPNLHVEDRRAPVDIFFRHLADTYGPRAIAVILSGTGANGSMGLKRVKERGGVAYAQNPREAEFNEMPRNAIATELIDEVLPVAEIPARIMAYKSSLGSVQILVESEKRSEPQHQALREIFTQLRIRTGHDFSNYKRPTLLRRIERRINIRNLPDLPSYTTFLAEHAEETTALLKDLLISVTNFFRDHKAFEALERDVMPAIFGGKTQEGQVRIWVAGCATGEEAYSIAMLCAERTLGVIDAPKIQIFASDIDESAIATAREGFYSSNDTADVSPDRLRRFFNREGDGYRIRREIREMILFAHHNFLKDPPFSRLDLVTCRNVLIYLNNTAQERVIETFHFGLKPKGFLFLGTSESVNAASDLYAVFNRDSHIFQAREVSAKKYPVPESTPTLNFLKNDLLQKADDRDLSPQRISFGDLHQKLLEQYAPPSLVVNEEYEIMHMTEQVGRYLEFAGGEPTKNLLKLIRPEIRLELRSALYQAVQHKTGVEARNIKLNLNGHTQTLTLQVRPVLQEGDTAKGFILIIFKQDEASPDEHGAVRMVSDEPVARQLEEELIRLKAQLRSSGEQHEFQAEELKASNEELQAMNEELRSAAEELETSKEELQSINEELRTVNQELKIKIDEISVVSNNLQNLINSTDVGTIFLDRSFCIRLFTPAVLNIFNLKSADYGRPVTDITNKLQYDQLLQDAETVLEKLTVIEREVTTNDNRFFTMRLLPYRTSEDRINGVVITFFDVTIRKQAEEILHQSQERYRIELEHAVDQRTRELKESKEQYATLVENTPDVITRWDKDLRLVYANAAFETKMGVSNENLLGKTNSEMGEPDEIALPYSASLQKAFDIGETVEHFNSFPSPDGEVHFYSRITPERNLAGEIKTVLSFARDITQIIKAGQEVKQKQELFQATMDSSIDMIQVFRSVRDEKGNIVDFKWILNNNASEKVFGAVIGQSLLTLNPGMVEAGIFEAFKSVVETGEPIVAERHYIHEQIDGWFYQSAVKLNDGVVTTTVDISSQKKTEQEILQLKDDIAQQATDRYLKLFNSIDDAFCVIKIIFDDTGRPADFLFTETNPAFEKHATRPMLGKRIKQVVPDFEQFWIDEYGRVARTGEVVSLENMVHGLGDQWFQTSAFRYGGDKSDEVAVLFRNVTARKREEKRQNFLFKLTDALRSPGDSKKIRSTVTHMLGQELQADRVLYVEYVQKNNEDFWLVENAYHLPGSPLADGLYPVSSFGDDLLRLLEGQTVVVNDVAKDAGIHPETKARLKARSMAAYIALPLMKENEFVAFVGIHQAVARQWTPEELSLLQETADRTLAAVERANAEQSLIESRELLRITMENAKDYAIITLDTEGRILQWSYGAALSFGYTEAEAEGQPMEILFTPEDRQANIAAKELADALEQGAVLDERWHIRKDGSKFFSNGVTRPIYNPQLAGFVKVTRNMTAQRLLEDQKDEFIAVASHEMKTPVTSIKLLTQYLREQSDNNEKLDADLVQRLDKQVNRLTQLIRDLLDTTKIAGGELSLNREQFDIDTFIEKHIEDLKSFSSGYSFSIDIRLGLSVYADKERISQVLTNLISNAMKYSETGTTIYIRSEQVPEGIRTSVTDKGIGIPEEMQAKIFDRFFRVNSEQMRGRSGMGLGLYISAGIIRRHGGSISVESKTGDGSVFSFIIPDNPISTHP